MTGGVGGGGGGKLGGGGQYPKLVRYEVCLRYEVRRCGSRGELPARRCGGRGSYRQGGVVAEGELPARRCGGRGGVTGKEVWWQGGGE